MTHVDWDARTAYVEPTIEEGRSRWLGAGQALRFELCQAIARVLARDVAEGGSSRRATERLATIRADYRWLGPGKTALVTEQDGRQAWWTFGGLNANAALADRLRHLGVIIRRADNFSIAFDSSVSGRDLLSLTTVPRASLRSPLNDRALAGLKFSACLPESIARKELSLRLTDSESIDRVLDQPVTVVHVSA